MEFADRIVLQILGTATRDALLDQISLEQLAEAAFDTSLHPLDGPFALDVARIDPGEDSGPTLSLDGQIVSAPGAMPTEVRLKAFGWQAASAVRADLLLRGTLIARHTFTDDRIEEVTGGFSVLDLDKEIEADLGGLPADSTVLETERRVRLLERLKAGAAGPGLIDDGLLDEMLIAARSDSVGDLLDRRGSAAMGRLGLKFRSGGAPVSVPVRLPVNLAVLARPAPFALGLVLAQSRAIQNALGQAPSLQAPAAELRRRSAVPILCFVPAELFDDDDWPGANRAARRKSAATLLGPQGVVLIPV